MLYCVVHGEEEAHESCEEMHGITSCGWFTLRLLSMQNVHKTCSQIAAP